MDNENLFSNDEGWNDGNIYLCIKAKTLESFSKLIPLDFFTYFNVEIIKFSNLLRFFATKLKLKSFLKFQVMLILLFRNRICL